MAPRASRFRLCGLSNLDDYESPLQALQPSVVLHCMALATRLRPELQDDSTEVGCIGHCPTDEWGQRLVDVCALGALGPRTRECHMGPRRIRGPVVSMVKSVVLQKAMSVLVSLRVWDEVGATMGGRWGSSDSVGIHSTSPRTP